MSKEKKPPSETIRRLFRDPVEEPDPTSQDDPSVHLVGKAVNREARVSGTIQRLMSAEDIHQKLAEVEPGQEPTQGINQELALMANATPRHRSTQRLDRLRTRIWRVRRAISKMANGKALTLHVQAQDLAAVKAHLLATIHPESMIKMILMVERGGRS